MVTERIEFPHLIIEDVTYQQNRTIINAFLPMRCECMCCKSRYNVCWITDEIFIFGYQVIIIVIYKIKFKSLTINDYDRSSDD